MHPWVSFSVQVTIVVNEELLRILTMKPSLLDHCLVTVAEACAVIKCLLSCHSSCFMLCYSDWFVFMTVFTKLWTL